MQFLSQIAQSTLHAGDPDSIPGSGRSSGEGIGYPLQYFGASKMLTQLVKNPPAMWETWILSLSWEDILEKGTANHSSILSNRWGNSGSSGGLYFFWGVGGFKIIADGNHSHEIKRCLFLGRKSMTYLDSILKSRDIILSTKVHLVKAMVFPVVMYGCESWTVKKAECRRIDAFEL